MKRCFKLIRADWTDLEYGKTKFTVGEVTQVTGDFNWEPNTPLNTQITRINYAQGIHEWCPMPGAPNLCSRNKENPINGTILIEIEPIDDIKSVTGTMVGVVKFNLHTCKSCKTLRQITELSQLI